MSEELMKTISREARLTAFVPCYLNQALQFTGDDMGKDRVMMMVLLYMIIVILAFVYAVIITNTIAAEANVIGTLRASGYTRRELVGHYITAPMAVTGAGAVAGMWR